MYIFIRNILDNLSARSKTILGIAIGVFLASIPSALAIILVNSSSFVFKNGNTEINLQGKTKALVNDAEYSNKILQQKLIDLEQEINSTKSPELAAVKESFAELKPTADQAIADNQELNEVIDSSIAN
jgi:hypothetical protein